MIAVAVLSWLIAAVFITAAYRNFRRREDIYGVCATVVGVIFFSVGVAGFASPFL